MDRAVIGENIRLLRENAGFTQNSIARFLEVDQSLVSKVEKGERSLSSDLVEKLASLFGVDVAGLEGSPVTPSKLSFAFRGSDFSLSEMEAVAAVNRIALNSEAMRRMLEDGND